MSADASPTGTREKPSIRLVRRYEAAPQKVWRAWTEPQALRAWFGPGEMNSVTRMEVDVRVGGRFRIAFLMPDGSEPDVSGTYLELDPGRRLVFTWAWEDSPERESPRAYDQLAAERLALPWVKVDKTYVFQMPDGARTLAQLFGNNSQLVVYHFMLGPDDSEGCVGCSFLTDHLEGAVVHLEHHDVSVIMVSRAPLPHIQRYHACMGWNVKWVSSSGNDFNHDYCVSFTPQQVASGGPAYNHGTTAPEGEDMSGISVFFKDAHGQIFHTYSSYGRGGEALLGTYMLLDMTPKGRNEAGPDGQGGMMQWVRRHDQYEAAPKPATSCCG